MASFTDTLKKTPANFMYVFIPDSVVHEFDRWPKILKKREEQIRCLRSYDTFGNKFEEYKNIIATAFNAEYGMTPGQAILHICEGNSHLVQGKTGVVNVAGIGKKKVVLESDGSPQGFYTVGDDGDVCQNDQGDIIRLTFDTQTGQAKSWYNEKTGEQISHWDENKKTWNLGSNGEKDVWGKVMNVGDWFLKIIEFLKNLFTKTPKIGDLSANQQDDPNRFVRPLQNTAGFSATTILILAVAGGVVYSLATKKR